MTRGAHKLRALDDDRLSNETQSQKRDKTTALIQDNATIFLNATQRVKQTLEVLKRFSHLDKTETTSATTATQGASPRPVLQAINVRRV